jgi:putative hemolysin
MPPILFSLLIILFLTLLNSFFVASELALVSARRARLQQRAEAGEVGAAMALKLTEHPETFLSSVQVCITLITIISGALGEKTLAVQLEPLIRRIPWLSPYSEVISSVLLILLLTYLSLVIGELAPKRLALNNAESIAVRVAPPLRLLTATFRPVSRLLNYSTDLVLKLFGAQTKDDRQVTEDEIKIMIGQGTEEGVFEAIEEEMVGQVFRLSDRTISALLTPRTDIVWLDIDDSPEEIREKVIESGFSRFPVVAARALFARNHASAGDGRAAASDPFAHCHGGG